MGNAPFGLHLTLIAARMTRNTTSDGFHWRYAASYFHTNALRSCEHDTSKSVTGDQSKPLTTMSCCTVSVRLKSDSSRSC